MMYTDASAASVVSTVAYTAAAAGGGGGVGTRTGGDGMCDWEKTDDNYRAARAEDVRLHS